MSIDISLDMDVKALLKKIDKLQHKDAKKMEHSMIQPKYVLPQPFATVYLLLLKSRIASKPSQRLPQRTAR